MIWNSDGLGDTAKHVMIQETVREQKIDFVAILETGRSNFTAPFLKQLAGGMDYSWYCLPPHGRSGGILAGFDNMSFCIQNVVTGDYCVKFQIKTKSDGFLWSFVVVYGAAQEVQKPEFLAELVRICENETLPLLVGGDFNIIRRQEEKNNANFNARWPFIFNAIIESLSLRELELSGRQYTWASRRDTPTYEKLDRFLASVPWEQKYPLVTVHAMTRSGSDHTPLIIDSGIEAHVRNKSAFSFELSWLRKEGFYDMICREWMSVTSGESPVERWQNKIRHLRQYLRGWAKNMSGEYKKLKNKLCLLIDELDIKAETSPLSVAENAAKKEADAYLAQLRRDEESKWAQRAKVKHVQEGGNNTKYFHLIANGKHRKKRIFQLQQYE